ncbi:MAG TPA: hypothetical protein VM369_07820 [Candidatus Binatia bacterium]|nr:hypothetical protein [Candidatus Binatia bacterium]
MSASKKVPALLALAVAACSPQSVNIREVAPLRYSAAVNAHAMKSCLSEAHARAEREARSYCDAHGRQLRAGPVDRQGSDETGCRVELLFGCTLPHS